MEIKLCFVWWFYVWDRGIQGYLTWYTWHNILWNKRDNNNKPPNTRINVNCHKLARVLSGNIRRTPTFPSSLALITPIYTAHSAKLFIFPRYPISPFWWLEGSDDTCWEHTSTKEVTLSRHINCKTETI